VTPNPAPATRASSGDGGTPAPLIVLAILAGLGLLGGALALAGRYLGWTPGWLAPAGHALREARMRVSTAVGSLFDGARSAPRPPS
jgi:hypothetical protein